MEIKLNHYGSEAAEPPLEKDSAMAEKIWMITRASRGNGVETL
jgi:hypothetical protein